MKLPLLVLTSLLLATQALAGPVVDAGAPSGGDDSSNLQALLNQGYVVSLRSGQTYRISRRLDITQSGSGIISSGTPARLYMTSTFNNVDPYTQFDPSVRSDSIGIRAENVSNVRLEGFQLEKVHLDGTYVAGIWLRGVSGAVLEDLELWGFSLGAIIALDSVTSVSVRGCTIRDSWANAVSSDPAHRKFPQLTGITVDDNKLTGAGGVAIGSTRVVVANNTLRKLRFKRDLFYMPRNLFHGMTSTSPVGYQTDGINVVPGGSQMTLIANVIDTVGEGIDTMASRVRVEENHITHSYDYAVKFVHGGSNSLVRGNTLGAAGTATVTVAGSSQSSVGNSYGNLIWGNSIREVGRRTAFCGSSADAGFAIHDTCPTDASAAAFMLLPNGGVQAPYFNTFFGNSVVAVSADVRMRDLIRVDAPAYYSLFYKTSFSNSTGRAIGNALDSNAVGTVVDASASTLAAGDFNGDGLDDLLVHWADSGQNRLYRQGPDRSFVETLNPIAPTAINSTPNTLVSGDFNGDGRSDLLFHWKSSGTNRMYLGGSSGFTQLLDPISPSLIGNNPDVVMSGDFDGDRRSDLLFFWRQAGTNRFFYGTTSGGFSASLDPIPVTAINGLPDNVVPGDYDGDGREDLLFHWRAPGSNRFYFGVGQGSFAQAFDPIPASLISNDSDRVLPFDGDLDGRCDLNFFWFSSHLRRLFLGQPSRTFLLD